MSEDRTCPHAFDCWYRVGGRCCHSLVEDLAACKGLQPTQLYNALQIKRTDPPELLPVQAEADQPVHLIIRRLIAG